MKNKLLTILLLVPASMLFASEAVPLSPTVMDHVTAGSDLTFASIARSISTAMTITPGLNFRNAVPARFDFAQLIGQPNADQLALLNRLNTLEWAQFFRMNPGESVTIQQLSPNGPITIERNGAFNSVSIATLKPGESAWIHAVTTTGNSYTYVANGSSLNFKMAH